MIIVQLNAYDRRVAGDIGVDRQHAATDQRRANHAGGISAFDAHILGTWGEYAVAQYLNLFWPHNIGGSSETPDVGGMVDVRATRRGTDLRMRPGDKDGRPYVHVVGDLLTGRMELHGWLYGRDAKARARWVESIQSMFAPPPFESMESLLALIQCGVITPDSVLDNDRARA